MTISETKKSPPEFRERACSFELVVAVGLADCEEDEEELDIGSTTRSGSYKQTKKSNRVTATDVKP